MNGERPEKNGCEPGPRQLPGAARAGAGGAKFPYNIPLCLRHSPISKRAIAAQILVPAPFLNRAASIRPVRPKARITTRLIRSPWPAARAAICGMSMGTATSIAPTTTRPKSSGTGTSAWRRPCASRCNRALPWAPPPALRARSPVRCAAGWMRWSGFALSTPAPRLPYTRFAWRGALRNAARSPSSRAATTAATTP